MLLESHINIKGLFVVLISMVGVMVTLSNTEAVGIAAFYSRILSGSKHTKKILQADKDAITVDENDEQSGSSVPVDTFWMTPYLKILHQIDIKKNWPIVIHTQSDRIAINTPLTVSLLKKIAIAPKSVPIKTSIVKPPNLKFPVTGFVEGGALYGSLSSGYGIWSNQYLRGFAHVDSKNSLGLLLSNNYEYREKGNYGSIDQVHIFNDEWSTSLSMGLSNKSIYLPRYNIGGTVFKKLKTNRALVPYMGLHAYWWRPVYSTQDINPGIIYYFQRPWIIELGAFINNSNPGHIYSASVYAVATQGQYKQHYLTLRVGFGKEAYLPLGADIPAAVGYFSSVITGTWRKWWGRDWGTNIVVENYNNPFYKRYSGSVGIFKDFSI